MPFICNAIGNIYDVTIEENDQGCNSVNEVEILCDTVLPLTTFTKIEASVLDYNLVELIYYTGKSSDLKFEVEHRSVWEPYPTIIGNLSYIETNGEYDKYNFLHKKPYSGEIFYRIKLTQDNGNYNYSGITEVYVKSNVKTPFIYPNPVIENMQVYSIKKTLLIPYTQKLVRLNYRTIYQLIVD